MKKNLSVKQKVLVISFIIVVAVLAVIKVDYVCSQHINNNKNVYYDGNYKVTRISKNEYIVEKVKFDDELEDIEENEVFTSYEEELLTKIAMAEAEGEGLIGKILVMEVVLNRVKSNEFPDTIEEVIFQENQFSPIVDGRWENTTADSECWDALNYIKNDDEFISNNALYFTSNHEAGTWHDTNLNYLFTEGNHSFYN